MPRLSKGDRPANDAENRMRYLAIDLGDKRTGLAIGDPGTGVISPITVLQVPLSANAGGELLRALAREIDRHIGPADSLVLGLPLNMDGTEGPRAVLTRAFGDRLASHTNRTIRYHDERLTSVEAERKLNNTGLTHGAKKKRRDALAAAALLESLFDELTNPTAGSDVQPDEPTTRADDPPDGDAR